MVHGAESGAAGAAALMEYLLAPACPRLLAAGSELAPFLVSIVAPPVAAARHLRALFAPRAIRITYIGACPAGADASIDARLGLTADEFRVEGDLVMIGPIMEQDALKDVIAEMEELGLEYFDDFFELSGNWPDWLQLFAMGTTK